MGRSLLFMIRDDEAGLDNLSRRSNTVAPHNPFDAVRAGIAAVDLAFVGLRPQGEVAPVLYAECNLRVLILMQLRSASHFTWSHSQPLQCLCCACVCFPCLRQGAVFPLFMFCAFYGGSRFVDIALVSSWWGSTISMHMPSSWMWIFGLRARLLAFGHLQAHSIGFV